MSERLNHLAMRIRNELAEIEHTLKRATEGGKRAKQTGDDDSLDGVALNLHSFYSGIERIFELIAINVDDFHRLYPLSLAELKTRSTSDLQHLLQYGGFPEPFLLGSEKETKRRSREYRSRLVREDLQDLERVKDLTLIEHMALRLPDLVGSPLSINALREDLQVSHKTVARWIMILENLYMIFRIYPFGAPKIRAVKKEAKHYHLDWTVVKDSGARFENMTACHLLKWCHFIVDTEGRDFELRYFRDIDKREVDFVLTEDGQPVHFIECKKSFRGRNIALRYLKQRFPKAKATQIFLEKGEEYMDKDGIRSQSAASFLAALV